MVAAFRSLTSVTYASRTNTVLSAPTGLANDDILLAAIFTGLNPTAPAPSPPSGFTQIDTPPSVFDDGGFNGKLSLFWKRAASESGSYAFTHSTCSAQGALLAISGAVTSGSPIDVFSKNSVTFPNSVSQTTTALSVTTTLANDLLFYIAHDWEGLGALSPPSGMTERFDSLIYVADVLQAVAGASGNKTQTNANNSPNNNPWAAWLVAIKSAGAGGAAPISGSASVIDAGDTASGSGSLKTSGIAAVVDAADLASSSGGLSIRGTAAASDADDIASGSGSLKASGAASVVDAGDGADGSGRTSISGASSVTDADDAASGSSMAYGRYAGTADLKDADDAAAGSGWVKIAATATIIDADDGATGAGTARIGAQASVAISDDSSPGLGAVRLLASGLVNFGDDTTAGAATVQISGGSSAVDANDLAIGIGFEVKPIVGSAAIVDEDDRASGFGASRQPVRHQLAATVAAAHLIEASVRSPVALTGRIKPPTALVGFLGEEKRRGFDLEKITHLQGDSFLGEVTVRDKNGIVSLSGAVISWRIAEKASDPVPLIEKTSSDGGVEVVDAVNGRINLRLSGPETEALPARDYYHQVRVTFPSGDRATVIREYLTIVETL